MRRCKGSWPPQRTERLPPLAPNNLSPNPPPRDLPHRVRISSLRRRGALGADQRDLAKDLSVPFHADFSIPQILPDCNRAFDGFGQNPLDFRLLPLPQRQIRALRRRSRHLSAPCKRNRRADLPRLHHLLLPHLCKLFLHDPDRVVPHVRRVQHHRDQLHPAPLRAAHEAPPRRLRIPGLDAVAAGQLRQQLVFVLHRAVVVPPLPRHGDGLRPHNPAEFLVLPRLRRDARQLPRGGLVPLGRQPVWVAKVRVHKPHLRRLRVHLLRKPLHAARNVDRQRHRRVVPAAQHQPVEQLLHRQLLPRVQIHAAPLDPRHPPVDLHPVVKLCVFQHHQRRHDLRRGRHRQHLVRVFLVEHPPRLRLHRHRRPRRDLDFPRRRIRAAPQHPHRHHRQRRRPRRDLDFPCRRIRAAPQYPHRHKRQHYRQHHRPCLLPPLHSNPLPLPPSIRRPPLPHTLQRLPSQGSCPASSRTEGLPLAPLSGELSAAAD